ncbi:MAG TPA: metal ABC transporter substrate-binding protein [Catenuloplanes sp.]|jgi:zinc transport system substrate-binding protein
MLIRSTPRTLLTAAATLLALSGVAGCDGGPADAGAGGRPAVVAAFYPLQFIAERVGGDAVTVSNLAPPGAEPHDLELSLKQAGQVGDAALVVYLRGFQPAVDEAVTQQGGDRAFDVGTVQPLLAADEGAHAHEGEPSPDPSGGEKDPHVWLDPTRLATIADQLAGRLGAVDPANAAAYTARARTLHADLDKLDQEYAQRLKNCQRREIITAHTAFGYLARRYQLEQVGITGLSPESEPSPQRVVEVAREAREHGATTIFFETLVSPKTAEAIAREVGARTAVLDPIEGLPAGYTGDYFTVMRTNLIALTTALGCS